MSSSPPPQPARRIKKTTSTLLDGNHAFPKFYACYLLRSRATENSQKTYVGSTPDPPRRLRQHNGELTQGAWKTSSGRPWEVQMIVYGFPSKLTALQFEWAWQHPFKSRHLRDGDGQIFKRDSTNNRVERRILTAAALLRSQPFLQLPLHVRCFTETAFEHYRNFAGGSSDAPPPTVKSGRGRKPAAGSLASRVAALPPMRRGVRADLDLRGMPRTFVKPTKRRQNGKRNGRAVDDDGDADEGLKDPGSTAPLLDLNDTAIRSASWDKWTHTKERLCAICAGNIQCEDHLSFALCPAEGCSAVTHLPCLSAASVEGDALVPTEAECAVCETKVEWGEIVRACYGRRDAGATARGNMIEEEISEEEEELPEDQDDDENDGGDEF